MTSGGGKPTGSNHEAMVHHAIVGARAILSFLQYDHGLSDEAKAKLHHAVEILLDKAMF